MPLYDGLDEYTIQKQITSPTLGNWVLSSWWHWFPVSFLLLDPMLFPLISCQSSFTFKRMLWAIFPAFLCSKRVFHLLCHIFGEGSFLPVLFISGNDSRRVLKLIAIFYSESIWCLLSQGLFLILITQYKHSCRDSGHCGHQSGTKRWAIADAIEHSRASFVLFVLHVLTHLILTIALWGTILSWQVRKLRHRNDK